MTVISDKGEQLMAYVRVFLNLSPGSSKITNRNTITICTQINIQAKTFNGTSLKLTEDEKAREEETPSIIYLDYHFVTGAYANAFQSAVLEQCKAWQKSSMITDFNVEYISELVALSRFN